MNKNGFSKTKPFRRVGHFGCGVSQSRANTSDSKLLTVCEMLLL